MFARIRRLRRRWRRLAATVAAVSALTGGGLTAYTRSSDAQLPPPIGELADLLTKVLVVPRIDDVDGYERECGKGKGCVFGPAWRDPSDHSGCDTRNRLIRLSFNDIEYKPGTRDCKALSGWRIDPYTGKRLELESMQPDHVLPLHILWNAGASKWDLQRRKIAANDLLNLQAVAGHINQSKRDKPLAKWLPPNEAFRCPYALRYLTVAVKYQVPITTADRDAAVKVCPQHDDT